MQKNTIKQILFFVNVSLLSRVWTSTFLFIEFAKKYLKKVLRNGTASAANEKVRNKIKFRILLVMLRFLLSLTHSLGTYVCIYQEPERKKELTNYTGKS